MRQSLGHAGEVAVLFLTLRGQVDDTSGTAGRFSWKKRISTWGADQGELRNTVRRETESHFANYKGAPVVGKKSVD